MMTMQDLLDLSKTIAAPLFAGKTYPWEALAEIGDFILQLGPTLPAEEYEQRGENIWIARDAKIFDSAYIAGPCIIDHGAELRQCAFVRGNAIVGKNAVVGNSCELKNVGQPLQSLYLPPGLPEYRLGRVQRPCLEQYCGKRCGLPASTIH